MTPHLFPSARREEREEREEREGYKRGKRETGKLRDETTVADLTRDRLELRRERREEGGRERREREEAAQQHLTMLRRKGKDGG